MLGCDGKRTKEKRSEVPVLIYMELSLARNDRGRLFTKADSG